MDSTGLSNNGMPNTSEQENFELIRNSPRPASSGSLMGFSDDDMNLDVGKKIQEITSYDSPESQNRRTSNANASGNENKQQTNQGSNMGSSSSSSHQNHSMVDKTNNSIHIFTELQDFFIDPSMVDFGNGRMNQQENAKQTGRHNHNIQELTPRRHQVNINTLASKHNGKLLSDKNNDPNTPTSKRPINHNEGAYASKSTEHRKQTDDDDIVVLEVQKPKPSSENSHHPHRFDIVKSQNRFSISKAKQSAVAAMGINPRVQGSNSDKFLEPLLVSISKLQQEKNAVQAEYQNLFSKHSKTVSHLEKSLNTTNALKKRVEVLVKVQEDIQEDLKSLKENKELETKMANLKLNGTSITEAIEKIGADYKSLQDQRNTIAINLSQVKVTQVQSKLIEK